MHGPFNRILRATKRTDLPDDDPSIEERFPDFPFHEQPTMRKMQRKCLMMKEWLRARPEEVALIEAEQREWDRRTAGPKPRIGGRSTKENAAPSGQTDWTDVGTTAPLPVRDRLRSSPNSGGQD
jgi:hypothetical protein